MTVPSPAAHPSTERARVILEAIGLTLHRTPDSIWRFEIRKDGTRIARVGKIEHALALARGWRVF